MFGDVVLVPARSENDQFFFRLPVFVFVETAAGVHGAEPLIFWNRSLTADSSQVFEGRRHQAVADVADQLDSIVDDLAGLEDRLQLCFVLVNGFSLRVETGGGQQRTCVIVQVGGQNFNIFSSSGA